MNIARSLAAAAISTLVFSFSSTGAAAAVPSQASGAVPVCPGPAAAGSARCHAQTVVGPNGKPLVTSTVVNGFRAADLTGAYSLPSATAGGGQTIAIVDAYNDPNAESDLA